MRLSAIPGSINLKKGVQNGPKFKKGTGTQKRHLARRARMQEVVNFFSFFNLLH